MLEPADGSLDAVTQGVELPIDALSRFAAAAHRDHGHRVARLDPGPDAIGVVALVAEQGRRRGQIVPHHQVEAAMIGGLPGRDVGSHRQAPGVDAEVDLGRLATSRTAETLARRVPLAPAAC